MNLVLELKKILNYKKFLTWDFNTESGGISNALYKISSIRHLLKYFARWSRYSSGPKAIDHQIFAESVEYLDKIEEDLTQTQSLVMAQNAVADQYIMVDPTRVRNQVDKDPDEFSNEDVSTDFAEENSSYKESKSKIRDSLKLANYLEIKYKLK